MARKRRKQTTRQRKVECSWCECILRMSLAAMRRHGVPTCGCGSEMYPADVEDAALCGDDVLKRHPDYAAEMRRECNRARREHRRSGAGMTLRCGGCQRFIRAANAACQCGFVNDIRGARNHGGYAEGAFYVAQDAGVPF